MYFFGILFLSLSLEKGWLQNEKNYFLLASLLFGYSCLLEGVQGYWVPGRSFEVLDIIANFIGVIMGSVTTLWIVKRKYYGN